MFNYYYNVTLLYSTLSLLHPPIKTYSANDILPPEVKPSQFIPSQFIPRSLFVNNFSLIYFTILTTFISYNSLM